MPEMPDDMPARRTRPVQVAKRKQKPLGQEEVATKKRSKTKAATTAAEDDVSNSRDDQEEPKTFISPEKYLDKVKLRDEDEEPRVFVSPLKYMSLANEDDERPRVGHKTREKRREDKEAGARPWDNKPSSSQRPLPVEKSTELLVD